MTVRRLGRGGMSCSGDRISRWIDESAATVGSATSKADQSHFKLTSSPSDQSRRKRIAQSTIGTRQEVDVRESSAFAAVVETE